MSHYGIFKGVIWKKRYYNHRGMHSEREVYQGWDIQRDEETIIWEGDFGDPPLKKGDLIHLHTLGKNVEVENVVRSTDGSIIYYTDYIINKIEDEETVRSKKEAEELYELIQQRLSEQEPLPRSEPPMKESWWEKLFGGK